MKPVGPLVSVIIPTKDRPEFLPRAVISALADTTINIEVVVVDDHSKRPASEALQDLLTDSRLRVIRLGDGKTGVSAARNHGLQSAQGDVFAFLDDDDTLAPGYLAKIARLDHASFDYGCSAYECRSASGSTTFHRRFSEGSIPRDVPIRKQLFGLGMGFWMTRACQAGVGDLDESLSINEDTDYFCRLLQNGCRGWYSAEAGVVVHLHGTQNNLANITTRSDSRERARCMRVLAERYPSMRMHLGAKYVDHTLKSRMTDEAWRFARAEPDFRMRQNIRVRIVLKYIAYCLAPAKRRKSA